MTITSKLPDVGTNIFTVMSTLAAEHSAINLSQGFPDFDTPPALVDRVLAHMRAGRNRAGLSKGISGLDGCRWQNGGRVARGYLSEQVPAQFAVVVGGFKIQTDCVGLDALDNARFTNL
jgi:methionine aminotransferase